MLAEEECRGQYVLVHLVHKHPSLLHQLKPKLLSFFHRDREVIYVFHNLIHNLFGHARKPLAISDLGTPPTLLLRRHIGSRDDAAMRINQEERQYLSVPRFRRIFELERSHSVLKYIWESKEPPFSCDNLTYLLHFGPILLYAVEFFHTIMIVLGKVSDKLLVRNIGMLCKKPILLPYGEKRDKYLAMGLHFEFFVISAMTKS